MTVIMDVSSHFHPATKKTHKCQRSHKYHLTRGIQKVCSLTCLITRYVHHILSLFNIVSCNWNALGPAFLWSSEAVVEELLILLFQPAISHADNFFPSRLTLRMWWSGPSSNTWFLWPTRVHIPNGISIGSAVFAGLTVATDQSTDRQTETPRYSVCNNRPRLHCSGMHPNNKLCNIVVKDGTNQSHNINEIYNVCLYQSTNFLNAPRKNMHVATTLKGCNMYVFALHFCISPQNT